MKDQDKIKARQIILDLAIRDKERWDLAVKIFFEDLKIDRFAVTIAEEYKREWDPERCMFYRITSFSTPRVKQTDTDPYTVSLCTKIIENNAIYRLVKTLLKTYNLPPEGTLIYQFLKEKLSKGNLYKFIDRISNSTIKSYEQKMLHIIPELQKMGAGLQQLFNDFIINKRNAEQAMVAGEATIKDLLFALRYDLLEDDNNTPCRVLERNYLLRVMSYIIDDNRSIWSFAANLNLNSYSQEYFDNIKRIWEVAKEIASSNQEQKAKIIEYRQMFIKELLLNRLNIKLISQWILVFKALNKCEVNNSFLEDSREVSVSSSIIKKFELKMHNSVGEVVKFNAPIINLNKIGYSFSTLSQCRPYLEFSSIDIGYQVDDHSLYNFLCFIATGQVNEVRLKDFLDLKELFDYFGVEQHIQEEIYNNYLLKFIQENESAQIVESLSTTKERQDPPLFFSSYHLCDYDLVTEEAVTTSYAFCERLASFVKNQCKP